MNSKTFSEAMGEIDSRYIDKALNYHRKRRIQLFPFAASLAVFLLSCGSAYTAYVHWGVGSADQNEFRELTQPFGTVAGEQPADERVFFEKSDLIHDYGTVYADHSVCVSTDEDVIPSLYFSPNYMVIFTQEDEKGWELKAGEKLTLRFSLDHTQSLELETGYVLNGEYHRLSLAKGCDFDETLTGTDEGEYYFCVTNHSSANAVIETGWIGKTDPDPEKYGWMTDITTVPY